MPVFKCKTRLIRLSPSFFTTKYPLSIKLFLSINFAIFYFFTDKMHFFL